LLEFLDGQSRWNLESTLLLVLTLQSRYLHRPHPEMWGTKGTDGTKKWPREFPRHSTITYHLYSICSREAKTQLFLLDMQGALRTSAVIRIKLRAPMGELSRWRAGRAPILEVGSRNPGRKKREKTVQKRRASLLAPEMPPEGSNAGILLLDRLCKLDLKRIAWGSASRIDITFDRQLPQPRPALRTRCRW